MAGTQQGFNAANFREKIRFVFDMAAPPDADRQVAFHFSDTLAFSGPADGEAVPFDPSEQVTRTVRPAIKRPCTVEFLTASDEITNFGVVIPAKVRVTLLDVDYKDVQDATFVTINGDRYLKHYEPPATGLFDVGLHQMVFIAENER